MPGTVPAACTFVRVNISGMVCERDGKVPRIALNGFDFAVCDQIDVQMPADLDQFGRKYSDRTIMSGKGLVELGHVAADGR